MSNKFLCRADFRRIAAAQSRIARNINFITIVNGSIELICRKKRTSRYDDRSTTSREINSFVLIAPFRRMQICKFRSRSAAFRHRPCVRDVCRSQGRPCNCLGSQQTKIMRKASIICVWNFHASNCLFHQPSNLICSSKANLCFKALDFWCNTSTVPRFLSLILFRGKKDQSFVCLAAIVFSSFGWTSNTSAASSCDTVWRE